MHPTNSLRATDREIPALRVMGAALTDAGAVRPANEDSVSLVEPIQTGVMLRRGVLAVVADGMGGHEGGEVASEIACRLVSEVY